MNKSLKAIKKKVDKSLKDQSFERDEQNRVVVEITVQNDKHFLSEFSQTETPVINSKIGDFIENSTNSISVKEPLTLRVNSDCISDQEKSVYSKGVKEYYKQKYSLIEKEIKQSYIVASILTFVSLIILISSFLFKNNLFFEIWSEAISIVAGFFLWEALGMFSFKTNKLRFKRNKYLTYISMKIEYVDLKNKNEPK